MSKQGTTRTRIKQAESRLAEYRRRLKKTGLTDAEIKRVLDPIECLHLQMKEDAEHADRTK
ncbi:MAG: hypothetical protein AMXMBFR77_16990 [Phycisphaerales bacterium]|nr:hypothetical protein [cyanobacterium CYA1]MDL1904530.1 hypothetical protein [Synechococcales cyanobacterium CNB]